MAQRESAPTGFQRNAFVPSLLAAAVLVLAPVLYANDLAAVVRYPVAILALIVAWFGWQARQWWWSVVLIAVAVVWNPVFPLPMEGGVWGIAPFAAAVVFIVAGVLIRIPRR